MKNKISNVNLLITYFFIRESESFLSFIRAQSDCSISKTGDNFGRILRRALDIAKNKFCLNNFPISWDITYPK